nr:dipeptidase [Nannocystis sp.]
MLVAVLISLATWLAPMSEDPALMRARALLSRVPLIDGHNDLAWTIREFKAAPGDVAAYDLRGRTAGHTDLPRLRAGQVGAQFWSVYVPGDRAPAEAVRVQLEQIDLARRMVARYPEALELVVSADELERAFAGGKVASLLGAEGGHVIADSLALLRSYHALGVRYMTLTHNVHTSWADCAASPPQHGGLTAFGEAVVREMNWLGMLVDLSHVSPETMDDALRVSEAPVIFSHSSARALTDVPRNVPDDVLRRVTGNGGVVMVTFLPAYVSRAAAEDRAARKLAQAEIARVRIRRSGGDGRPSSRRVRDRRRPWPRWRTTSSRCAGSRGSTTWGSAATSTECRARRSGSRTSRSTHICSPSWCAAGGATRSWRSWRGRTCCGRCGRPRRRRGGCRRRGGPRWRRSRTLMGRGRGRAEPPGRA